MENSRVYINRDLDRKLEKMEEWLEENGEGIRTLIGEDFNAGRGGWGGRGYRGRSGIN